MEGTVAEENAAAKEASAAPGGGGKSSLLLIALAVINMLAVGGVGFMLYSSKQKEAKENTIDQVIEGEAHAQHAEANTEAIKAPVVPLETFIVNLAGSKGRRILRVDLELEVSDTKVVAEIEQRKAQIRDIIIIMLSGRTYDQISAKEGKNELRDDIKGTLNAFLTKGKVSNVFFTNLLYN
ncbi:MAG: flagellar basal body-associated FliL family protein [Bdellovibrionaceae bacterium]|nr:flagellar basal body-associated FliL family protein [Pseudobdellovibrionaceae bacterium]